MSSLGADLRAFIDASPTPFHAVAEMASRLSAGGFSELSEQTRWSLAPGDQRYVVRDGGSLIAFRVGRQPLADTGLIGLGSHTDSPTFKVRPHHDLSRFGYRLVGVEPYGGMLAHTWMDRELMIAGRVTVLDGSTRLVRLDETTLRLPSLAIHLDGSVREGLTLDPQRHLVPVLGLESEPAARAAGCHRCARLGPRPRGYPALGAHRNRLDRCAAPRQPRLVSQRDPHHARYHHGCAHPVLRRE
jgi:aspartyl aminopeptidase